MRFTAVLRGYLSAARTNSARELAAKAVVLVSPERVVGKIAWPCTGSREPSGHPRVTAIGRRPVTEVCLLAKASAKTPAILKTVLDNI